jgi:hypothetical protein
MLNETSITTVAQNASSAIISSLNVPPELVEVTKANWREIVKLITQEIFNEIKRNAVVEVDVKELISINVQGVTLVAPPGGGPVTGTIVAPTSTVELKGTGKIT